jgi:hypothetical protein
MKLENIKRKSIVLCLVSLLVLTGKTFKLFEVPENFSTLVDLLLTVLIGLGIVIDDKKE